MNQALKNDYGCRGGCSRLWVTRGLPESHKGDSFPRAGDGVRREDGPVGRALSGAAFLPPGWPPLPAPLW